MKPIVLTLAICALILGVPRYGDADSLNIATGEYAACTNPNVPTAGMVKSVALEVTRETGFDVRFQYMPLMRALELTRSGHFDGPSYWGYHAERATDFPHVGQVMRDPISLFHHAVRILPAWTDIADPEGSIIGAATGHIRSDDFQDLAESGVITVQTAQSDEANMRELRAGRIATASR